MRNRLNKRTLNRNYFIILILFLFIAILLSLWFVWFVHKSDEKAKNQLLLDEISHLNREIVMTFDYLFHLMKFMGEKIAQNKSPTLEHIASVFCSPPVSTASFREQFSWTVFDWVTPDKRVVVNSMYGILSESKNAAHRRYTKTSVLEPWKLHFELPDIGLSSGEYVIPIALGVTNKEGTFLGTIAIGLSINQLSKRLNNIIHNSNMSFVVLAEKRNIVLSSQSAEETEENVDFGRNNLFLPAITANRDIGFLNAPMVHKNVRYSVFKRITRYPSYTILLGYKSSFLEKERAKLFLPGIIIIVTFGLMCSLALAYLHYLLVAPIVRLSSAVDQLMASEEITRLKGFFTYETYNLAKQILKLQYLIKREKKSRERISKAIEITRKSDAAREEFLSKINRSLILPLYTISHNTNILLSSEDNKSNINIPSSQRIEFLEGIMMAVANIRNLTTDVLDLSYINIKKVIEESVIIISKLALERDVDIVLNLTEDLPAIYADELRLKQIIVGLISRALALSPRNSQVFISTDLQREEKSISITIKDHGFRLDDNDLKRISEQFDNYGINFVKEGITLDLNSIKKLVEIHEGKFFLEENTGEQGITITLLFPIVLSN